MSTDKAQLRRRFLTARAALSAADKQHIDREITRAVLASEPYRRADTVFLYVSTAEEIDTRALLRDALAAGKTVCVPLCGRDGEMTARRICAESELKPGKMGILEPSAAAECVPPAKVALALIPALACDRTGCRLGYGGGYYDRYLAKTDAVRMALCAETRLVDCLPCEPHDRRCGWIITERRVLRTDEEN